MYRKWLGTMLCYILTLSLCTSAMMQTVAAETQQFSDSFYRINQAGDIGELKSILAISDETVFYPEEVYAYFIGRDFADDEAVLRELSARMAQAEESPKVALFCDGGRVTKPGKGTLSLQIAPILKNGITVVAALYEKERLIGLDIKMADGETETVLSPGISGGETECRLLFFDSLTAISPTDFYGASNLSVYVSPGGDDSSAKGTKKFPFRTIEGAKAYANKIKSRADSDVHVILLPGAYHIENPIAFTVEDSGYGEYDVVYRGEPGEAMPLISGGVKVDPSLWQAHENGIYKAHVPEITEARQMYINGIPAQRSVSSGWQRATGVYQKENSAYEEDGFILANSSLPHVSKPSELEMVAQLKWVTQRVPVENILQDGENDIVLMDQPMYDSYVSAICSGGIQPVAGTVIYFENALEFIDEPGEFYFDEDDRLLYYYPYKEDDLKTAEVYLPKSNGIFRIEGTDEENRVKNLRFSHLDIRHGAWNSVNETGFCSFQADCMLEYDVHAVSAANRGLIPLAQIQVNRADRITINDCLISNVGSTGIGMHESVSNCSVERNVIRDISGTGVSIGSWRYNGNSDPRTLCDTIVVKNNYVTRIGQEHMGSLGLGVYYAKNVSLLHNDIKDMPYSGISVGWGWSEKLLGSYAYGGHTISGNRVESVCQERYDGGQIYTLGHLSDSVISRNYVIDSRDNGGIYLDSGSSHLVVSDNVAKACRQWLFLNTTSGTDTIIKNNYSDMNNFRVNNGNTTNYQTEETKVVEGAAWTGESAEIVAASGIEAHLRSNLSKPMEYPAWRKSLYDYIPQSEILEENEYLIEAENYMDGGSGVGFWRPSGTPMIYAQSNGVVIGSFGPTHWCKYSFCVEKAGTYKLELRSGAGPDPLSEVPLVTVEVNDAVAIEKAEHATIPASWESFYGYHLGKITLREGENTIKILNEQCYWTYDNFKLTLVE